MATHGPTPLPSFGIVPRQYDAAWYSAFIAQLGRRLALFAGPSTVQPELLLQSPDGTIYRVTVGNTGTLTTTALTVTDRRARPAPL